MARTKKTKGDYQPNTPEGVKKAFEMVKEGKPQTEEEFKKARL